MNNERDPTKRRHGLATVGVDRALNPGPWGGAEHHFAQIAFGRRQFHGSVFVRLTLAGSGRAEQPVVAGGHLGEREQAGVARVAESTHDPDRPADRLEPATRARRNSPRDVEHPDLQSGHGDDSQREVEATAFFTHRQTYALTVSHLGMSGVVGSGEPQARTWTLNRQGQRRVQPRFNEVVAGRQAVQAIASQVVGPGLRDGLRTSSVYRGNHADRRYGHVRQGLSGHASDQPFEGRAARQRDVDNRLFAWPQSDRRRAREGP